MELVQAPCGEKGVGEGAGWVGANAGAVGLFMGSNGKVVLG